MKLFTVLLTILCLNSLSVCSQNIYDARQSVLLQATVQENPPKVLLSWVLDTANGGYTVWRKAKHETIWGDSMVALGPGITSWVDTTVSAGFGYEYQVRKSLPAFPYGNGTPNFGAGYIYAGINLPPAHHRGTCLVVIDSTFKQTLAPEISRLLSDIQADGWQVRAIYVDRNDPVTTVKSYIQIWAGNNPDNNQVLFLFGRVPVPYSGVISPDSHFDHRGAWPSDGYYANLDGVWTDSTANITSAPGTRNDNVPGDGKFDHSFFPTAVKLQVGRVDFANMTKFPESEEQLLRRYLDKDHAWRTGKMPMMERGLVDNNFPADLDGFGEAGWKNFSPMFGYSNVKDLQYRQTLSNQSYMWSYGCGGGGPESASDISSTTNFTTDSLQTVFTMIFGSYFGDWDYPNDFLRGAIASRTCLASTWGNRPVWFLHHMALGEHIGYSAKVTMTNLGLYTPRYYGTMIHSALMGDPTLRMHMLRPIENLSVHQAGLHVQLTWQDPTSALGYFIYKRTGADTAYSLLNQVPVTSKTYMDACPGQGLINYMVRSVELRTSGSGTFYNLSAGVSASILSDPSEWIIDTLITMVTPGQSNGAVSVNPQGGCLPYNYYWNTGQTTAGIQDLNPGIYCVTISDCLGCTEVYCASVELSSGVSALPALIASRIYPNPAEDKLVLELDFETAQDLRLEIINAKGQSIAKQKCNGKDIQLIWDLQSLEAGLYWLRVESVGGVQFFEFIKAAK